MIKRILITGGAGFIGSNIVKKGLELGHDITVLDNLSTGYKKNIEESRVQFVEGDIRNRELLFELTKDKDAVFHLAANVGNVKSIESPLDDSTINLLGTINLLDAMVRNNVPKIIYSSTAAGYGEPKYLPVDEEHPMNADSPYGVSKISAEKMILCYSKLYGFQASCLRYFNAYGVNQRFDAYGNVIPIFLRKILNNEPLTVYGDGEQTRDFVNVHDISRANWMAFENNVTGYFNVATGQGSSINQLLNILKRISKKELDITFSSPRKGEVKHSVANGDKAKQVLNFTTEVSLEEGLTEYWNWFIQDTQS
jgi:nucleoside-diphosphate-sugar epimerase